MSLAPASAGSASPAPVRMRRYILGAVATIAVVWAGVGAYITLTPPTYASQWTFILPTASSTSSMQVESIGQAQVSPSSPFGSAQLSPKVIYREIIKGEKVRRAAAKSLDMPLTRFGDPQIKLVDETAMLVLDMRGPTPADAQAKAEALIAAFLAQLDTLRGDEIRRRAEVVQNSLHAYEANLKTTRERIMDQQRESGVLSINQFNEGSTSMELMRRRLGETRSDLAKLVAEQERLTANLGLDPASASQLLQLSADPAFAKLASDFADANSAYRQDSIRMGGGNPLLTLSRGKSTAALRALKTAYSGVGGHAPENLERLLSVTNGSQRAELVKSLVYNQGTIAGKREEIRSLEGEFKQLDIDVKRMSLAVARLEDLKKEHLVAEAVYTSAFARLNTGKVDVYASYPMVQTLSPPDLPERRSSPYVTIALLAGALGSALAMIGWSLAWLGQSMRGRKKARLAR